MVEKLRIPSHKEMIELPNGDEIVVRRGGVAAQLIKATVQAQATGKHYSYAEFAAIANEFAFNGTTTSIVPRIVEKVNKALRQHNFGFVISEAPINGKVVKTVNLVQLQPTSSPAPVSLKG